MRSAKKILPVAILASVIMLFLSACAEIGTAEITSDRDVGTDGSKLYALHCSACHGNFGRGGVGVPLALEDFLQSVSNQYIALSIRFGRPGRVMPSFPRLTDQEVQAITEYVRSFQSKLDSEPTFSEEPIVGDPESGAGLFVAFCARCHGANGEGGQGTGVSFSRPMSMSILAPALNNTGYLASATDQVIKRSMVLGRTQTPMRSLLEMGLSDQNINDLVSYIRSFQLQSMVPVAIDRPANAVLVRRSPYSYRETIQNIKRAISTKGFSVVSEQMLGEGVIDPGAGDGDQHVIYFASLTMLTNGLAKDPRMGLFLPGKIIVVKQKGEVKILASNPKQYSALFNNKALQEFTGMLYRAYRDILSEAIL